MTTLELLQGAKALLSDPTKWTKGAYAKRADGTLTYHGDGDAECYCVRGAVMVVGRKARAAFCTQNALDILDELVGNSVENYNDKESTTHADILALLDKAIERLS